MVMVRGLLRGLLRGRMVLCLALGAALGPAARAHDPSGGGPDDPEALGRPLVFDTRLAEASQPPDERPLPWVLPRPVPAPVAGPGPERAPSPSSPPRPRVAAGHGMDHHAAHAVPAPPGAP